MPLPAVGSERGRLWNNYKGALRFLSTQTKQETIERLRSIYTAMLEQVSVVQIDVLDPMNGPKIFDSLNSRQEPMTTGDLVRNEIFSRVADSDPVEVESLDQQYWQPFYDKFKNANGSSFDDYFFPFGLLKNPNLKKSDVYAYLRSSWKNEQEPAKIVASLATYQNSFLDLWNGTNGLGLDTELADGVKRLSTIAPTSTYPFLMPLLSGLNDGSIGRELGVRIMGVIESFLVRRALCGHEPTGLHAVFKRLWQDCGGDVSVNKVTSEIRSHKTVVWPTTDEVKACVEGRILYGSSITKFFLQEWNRSLGGDDPKIVPWIEHVLPDGEWNEWKSDFSEDEHKRLKDTLANLIPLSQPMNQGLGTKAYVIKRERYLGDSAFKGPRMFATEYTTWNSSSINQRAKQLSEWAVSRWAD